MPSLKAQRERVARGLCGNERYIHDEKCGECRSITERLRELQRAAIRAWEQRRRQPDCAGDHAAIDALLDEKGANDDGDRG